MCGLPTRKALAKLAGSNLCPEQDADATRNMFSNMFSDWFSRCLLFRKLGLAPKTTQATAVVTSVVTRSKMPYIITVVPPRAGVIVAIVQLFDDNSS
jgi:hypothetical protein